MLKRIFAGIIFYPSIVLITLFWASAIVISGWFPSSRKNGVSCRGHNMAGIWGRSIFSVVPGWKVEVEGRENIPGPDDPVVMVANHESMVDILVMYFLRTQFRWLSKASVFRIPIVGPAMLVCGHIPVHRGEKSSHEIALATSAERIRSGISMFFFPEGTRSEIPGQMRPFKVGAFKLSAECGVDVLPIALIGTGKVWRKNGKLPDAATVRIKVLPRTRKIEGETYEAYASRVRSMIESALAGMAQAPETNPET